MMVSRMMMNINKNMARMDKIYNDYTSGKRIHRPSDNPVLVARSLKIHTDIAENDQFKRNVDDAYSILDKTETSLKELNNVLHRVRELTTQASNGVLTPEDTMKIESEIKQIKEQIVKISNDTYVGRHIFSGYETDKPYLNENGTNNINLDKEIRSNSLNLPIAIAAAPNNEFKLNITGIIKSDGTKYTGEYTVQLPNKTYDGTINTLEDLKNDLQNALNTAQDITKTPAEDIPDPYKGNFEVTVENNQIVIKNSKVEDNQKFALKSDTLDLKNLGFEKLNISESTEKIDYHIGISASISINIRGDELFGPVVDSDNDNIPDKTIMDTMNELIGLLENGDTEEISKKLDEIDAHMNNVSKVRAAVGARTNTVETIRNRIEDTKVNFTNLLSQTEDTDMAEASMQFMMADSVYRASLNIGAKIIQPSLMDFIR
jgi:flagellar hook-associated protein 3 FlgL